MSESVVRRAAALRGARDFQGVVRLVRECDAELADESRIPALLEAFYAATEGGLQADARALATEIAAMDPDIPSVKAFLGKVRG